eukprot:COSAG05_NODE_9618_length_611_cov_1.248047_1_plen_111_part_00
MPPSGLADPRPMTLRPTRTPLEDRSGATPPQVVTADRSAAPSPAEISEIRNYCTSVDWKRQALTTVRRANHAHHVLWRDDELVPRDAPHWSGAGVALHSTSDAAVLSRGG